MTDPKRRNQDQDGLSGMSTWVKVTLVFVGVVVLIVVLMLLVGGGGIGGHQIPQHAPFGFVGGW